jgi:hypothetical protein
MPNAQVLQPVDNFSGYAGLYAQAIRMGTGRRMLPMYAAQDRARTSDQYENKLRLGTIVPICDA